MGDVLAQPHHDGSEAYVARAARRTRRRHDRAPARARERAGGRRRRPLRPRRRAAVRRRGEGPGDRVGDVVARDLPRGQPDDAVPLAALGRQLRLRLAQRDGCAAVRRHRRRRLRRHARSRAARTGTSSPSSTRSFPTASRRPVSTSTRPSGRSRATGTSCRPGAGPTRRSSGSAATSRRRGAPRPRLSSLGANVLYLTPVFPAQSTHRYDASTFEQVDPLLGGDEAFVSLIRAAHDRGIRVRRRPHHEPRRGSSTSGSAPRRTARSGARLLLLRRRARAGYECWCGVPVAAEARLPLARPPRADVRRARARSSAAGSEPPVRPRRLAHRRREHDRAARRRRRPPGGRAGRAARPRSRPGPTRSSSPSTRTTCAPISARAAGTGR